MDRRNVVWTKLAKHEFKDIFHYYYLRNGTKACSTKLNQSIQKSIQVLSSFTEFGLKTDIANVIHFIYFQFGILAEIFKKDLKTIQKMPINAERADSRSDSAKHHNLTLNITHTSSV